MMNTTIIFKMGNKILVLLLIVFMVACGTNKKKQSEETAKEFEKTKNQVEKKVEQALNDIPPPSEIPYIIHNTGADFNPNIVNDLKNYESYMISPEKAAFNLGIYATDIGYLTSYGKTQDALNYMDVCLKLADAVGVQDAIDMHMLERFERNMSNTDSLGAIINEVIANSDRYLNDNNRSNIAALVVSGNYIEALYIATQIIDTYPKDLLPDDQRMTILAPMIRLLADQKNTLKDMISLLKSVETKDEWILATVHSLDEMYENYLKFNPNEKIREGKGNEVLNDEVLANLTQQVSKIRSNIVY